jgi:hypothetical protein
MIFYKFLRLFFKWNELLALDFFFYGITKDNSFKQLKMRVLISKYLYKNAGKVYEKCQELMSKGMREREQYKELTDWIFIEMLGEVLEDKGKW